MIEHYDLFWLAPLCGIRLYCCCSNCHWFWYLSTSLSSYIPFFFFWQKFYSFFVCPYFCNLLYYCLGLLKCTPSYAVEFKSSTSCFVTVHFFYVNFFFIIVLVLFDSITSVEVQGFYSKPKLLCSSVLSRTDGCWQKIICHICLALRPMAQIWLI